MNEAVKDTLFTLQKPVAQALSKNPVTDSLAHLIVLGLTFLVSSQILSTVTVQSWAQDGVRILLILGVLILGIVYAVLVINDAPSSVTTSHTDTSMIHTLSWILILPLIVYLFQSNLENQIPQENRVSLWLLLMLVGGAFQALFASKFQPVAIQAFYGLLAAGVLLEVYQVARSTLTTERKALTIALFVSWLAQGIPFFFNGINREIYWGINDLISILLFLYFLLYEQ